MIPSDLKNKYPTLKDCTYLNTAYTGVVSSSLLEWRRAADQNYAVQVDQFKSNQALALETNAQLQVARLMHTEVDQVFLASSCSAGLQAFLFKIPRDYKFLLLQDDYPAITQMVSDHQFDYTEISLQNELEVSVLAELRQNKYEVFAFSAVQYNSGLLFDMEFLHTIKEEFPSLSREDVVIKTCRQRLRPILLTTATTIFGLMPLAMGLSIDVIGREIIVGSRVVGWWGALASSIVFGLAFSTVLTLIFTPAALVIPSRIKAWMQNRYDLFKPTS